MDRRSAEYWIDVINELRELPVETEWVEFKENNSDPNKIGEYISALSNSAVLAEEPEAYLIWGVEDDTHDLVGTTFRPNEETVGNENLENWLLRSLDPQIHFAFHCVEVDEVTIVVLEIDRTTSHPVRFRGDEYIRIGSYKKKLKDHPDRAKRLYRSLDNQAFESGLSMRHIEAADILTLIDYPSYFELVKIPLPENRSGILSRLNADQIVTSNRAGSWDITNLGAILFARSLSDFERLERKAIRVVQYRGDNRVDTIRERQLEQGYAAGFAELVDYIMNLLPSNEVIGKALREEAPAYPELAIREIVANALVHQDFSMLGSGAMIEIVDSRIEVTSPGLPLVSPTRFVDAAPRSRNEKLASMMRRLGICEERGSGWDKVAFQIEFHQLPAPLIEIPDSHTRIVLFAATKPLRNMAKEDRIRAVYLHACLRQVSHQHTTNTSVRERFDIPQKNSAIASRIIAEAVEAGLIAPYDPNAAPKLRRYVPIWAIE